MWLLMTILHRSHLSQDLSILTERAPVGVLSYVLVNIRWSGLNRTTIQADASATQRSRAQEAESV